MRGSPPLNGRRGEITAPSFLNGIPSSSAPIIAHRAPLDRQPLINELFAAIYTTVAPRRIIFIASLLFSCLRVDDGARVFGASRKTAASGRAVQRQARIPRYRDDTILWRFFHLIGVHAPQELKTTFTLDLQPTAVINQVARDDSENLLVFPDGCRANTPSGEKKSYRPEFLLSVAPAANFSNFACKSKSRRRSKSRRTKFQEFSGERGAA